MTVEQIYSTVNSIGKNMTGVTANVTDISSFVDFGNETLSSATNKECFINTLIDRIGRTIFAIRAYNATDSDILVDSFTFGSVLQKISYALQDATSNSDWSAGAGDNPYTEDNRPTVVQNLFVQKMPTFATKVTISGKQLESAFVSPSAMGGFIDGIYTALNNKMELSKEGLNTYAKNALFAKVYSDETNATYRVRKVLTEYNTLFERELTATTAKTDKDFLYWLRKELKNAKTQIGRMNKIYNNGTVERFTPSDKLHFDLSMDWANSYEQFYSNIYNEEFVSLPKYKIRTDYGELTKPEEINVKLESDGEVIKIEHVIGMMYDDDAVIATIENYRAINMYDQWNDRSQVKQTMERRFCVDISENAIVWVCE